MTTAVSRVGEWLARVKTLGYWRVIVHPSDFEQRRIPTLSACRKLIDDAQVTLGGWYYPHVERSGIVDGDDWVESGGAFLSHLEVWRLYQSGQFVHHIAMDEDVLANGRDSTVLDFLDATYRVTEILEFAARLAYRNVLDPYAVVRIELHGTQGRQLVGPARRPLVHRYVCDLESVAWEATLLPADLYSRMSTHALDAAVRIFEQFNWIDPSRSMLAEDQRRLLERRL